MESNAIFDIDGNDPVVLGIHNDMAQGYRHGFANGRAERLGGPRALAATIRIMAEQEIALDLRARGSLS